MAEVARLVVVTGATGGLGRAFAAAFAALGDRLVLTDLDAAACAAFAAECGTGSVAIACDLGDLAAIGRFWAWMDAEVGTPDVLLNNAGVGPARQPTLETDLEDFARMIAVHLMRAARMLDAAAACMTPGGAIASTASLAGLVSDPRQGAYGAAKAAPVSRTRRADGNRRARGLRRRRDRALPAGLHRLARGHRAAARQRGGAVVYLGQPEDAGRVSGLRAGGMAMLLRGMAAAFGPDGLRINGILPAPGTGEDLESAAHLCRFLAGPGASSLTGTMIVPSDPVGRIFSAEAENMDCIPERK